jgi:hypothetical protein
MLLKRAAARRAWRVRPERLLPGARIGRIPLGGRARGAGLGAAPYVKVRPSTTWELKAFLHGSEIIRFEKFTVPGLQAEHRIVFAGRVFSLIRRLGRDDRRAPSVTQ